MAKNYRQWVESSVEADTPSAPLQGRKLVENWWHYHKWIVVGCVIAALCLVRMAYDLSGFGTVKPDVQIAYVGSSVLPDASIEAVADALETICPDLNGDGQTVVQLNQYAWSTSGPDSDSIQTAYAMQTLLAADIENAESYFFLLNDAQSFQRVYQILAMPDGSCPAESDSSTSDKVVRWADCPQLAALIFPDKAGGEQLQQLLGDLVVGRRCFYDSNKNHVENESGCDALWHQWTGR